ncbi:unnamed protein product [Linum trigynum]|uniref:Uncharacterized protein n=1 Tax=Linum trigynum TaxID=586398 RepID=A0AAV2EPF0_9ROSI
MIPPPSSSAFRALNHLVLVWRPRRGNRHGSKASEGDGWSNRDNRAGMGSRRRSRDRDGWSNACKQSDGRRPSVRRRSSDGVRSPASDGSW